MKIFSFSPFGYEGAVVSVEVDLRRGIPAVDIVGLADNAVKESRERMRSAILNSGYEFPKERVLISLSPADMRKEGAGFDLPIAVAVLNAERDNKSPGEQQNENADEITESVLVMGELDLSGKVRSVRGVHAAVLTAKENGISCCIVPKGNYQEAVVPQMHIFGVENLKEAFECLSKIQDVNDFKTEVIEPQCEDEVCFAPLAENMDYSTVKNQGTLLRGLQIAAAGFHNLMVYGPPGCGKTLAVQRLPSILPLLTLNESQTVTRIYSLAGLLPAGSSQISQRPFRQPHQTSSLEGMSGGGVLCRPGEISLAHNGVLFLDEAAEFRTSVLQGLRIPLETGSVTLSRAGRHTTYPANFQLIIATNPCPCGNYGSKSKICLCSARSVEFYWKKFSAPLLDRVDIRIPVFNNSESVSDSDSNYSAYNNISTEELRQNIARAVKTQRQRQGKMNALLSPEEVRKFISLDENCGELLEQACFEENFSARGMCSIKKLARTIADMAGSEVILPEHIKEAVFFRKNTGGLDFCL
ncbi:MAG: YifB family Mg chelatase-like AAA ATPase [Spirochaetaceae bacterium]|nr:YifB family Mg chelatase-like AAA ATPase [Spirochaetaceae bacterium]